MGAYESEKKDFEFAIELTPGKQLRTIEAELMDWADDVTYSVHDIEDFYRADRMPLHLLANSKEATERNLFFENIFERRETVASFSRRTDLQEAFTSVMVANFPMENAYFGAGQQRAALRMLSSNLIGRYIGAITLKVVNNRCRLQIDPERKDEVTMLKELVWTYVIEAPALASQQFGQRRIIRDLFEIFAEASMRLEDQKIFPAFYRERLREASNEAEKKRICVDLIAGMTENQAVNIHRRLTGSILGSAPEDLLD